MRLCKVGSCGLALIGISGMVLGVQPMQPDSPQAPKADAPKSPTTAKPDDTNKPATALTAQEHLEACAKLYKSAKTYRDEGDLRSVIQGGGQIIVSSQPFSTAFERDGRFRWEFKGSVMPGGKPDKQYVVWSDDQKVFRSRWDARGKAVSRFDSISIAMAGPTGISGGSATAIVPLLRPDFQIAFRTTDVKEPSIKGTEKVDGVECTMIGGINPMGPVVLWLDADDAIRKIKQNQTIDPTQDPAMGQGPKLSAETVITIKPMFNEKIDDKYFEPKTAEK